MVWITMLLHLLCIKHSQTYVIFAVSGHLHCKVWGLIHRPYDFRLQTLNSQCQGLHAATITERGKGFSSGKSEAKRGPKCRMLPFKSGMQEVTSGWQCLSEAQWKNCHVHFKKHQAMTQKLIALQYTAQNKVLILEAVTLGNAIEYESFYVSVDFIHFTWIVLKRIKSPPIPQKKANPLL